nr:hypothetical protein [uncultured Sediminibacterium sp.]
MFEEDIKIESKPVGSALFLKINSSYFIVSAAHVLAEHHNKTYVIIEDNAVYLNGDIVSTKMPASGTRDDDKTDLSIIKINLPTAEIIMRWYVPITEGQIERNHPIENSPKYFCYGFPLTRTYKLWGKDEIKTTGISYQSQPAENFKYHLFGFSLDIHIALRYDGGVTTATNPQPHLAADPTGMSGCGLWHFFGKTEKALIGVIIQRIKKPGQKAIIATRIDMLFSLIAKFDPAAQ